MREYAHQLPAAPQRHIIEHVSELTSARYARLNPQLPATAAHFGAVGNGQQLLAVDFNEILKSQQQRFSKNQN